MYFRGVFCHWQFIKVGTLYRAVLDTSKQNCPNITHNLYVKSAIWRLKLDSLRAMLTTFMPITILKAREVFFLFQNFIKKKKTG